MEIRAARAERRRGCCNGRRHGGVSYDTSSDMVDRTNQRLEGHQAQTRGLAQQPDTAFAPHHVDEGERIDSTEWHPLSVPDEAPPSYREVVKA